MLKGRATGRPSRKEKAAFATFLTMSRAPSPADIIVHVDGASRGNPGPAAYAVVMEAADGMPLVAFSNLLGKTTNNVAEYQALLAALDYALSHHHLRLRVKSDSELLVRQINGLYKVRNADLKALHEQARQMIGHLKTFRIEHVPREENREADRLVNKALDAAGVGARSQSAFDLSQSTPPQPLRSTATYRRGILELHHALPLAEGEEVNLEIRRKN